MKNVFKIGLLLFVLNGFAQDKASHTVYFELDKDHLKETQKDLLCDFFQKIDSTHIESISVFGYCDDRGTTSYNFDLSNRRVQSVETVLIRLGLHPKKVIALEGKGRIMVDKDTVSDLNETRSKNRRVEIVVKKTVESQYYMGIPKLFTEFQSLHKKGDRIYLEHVNFSIGSSYLDLKSRNNLDKAIHYLKNYPNILFEIQGHVCCTPPQYTDALDKVTRDRKLSYNRAKAVYRYLVMRKIDPSRMTFKGYGNRFPLGKAVELDRRVEIVITKF
jgi:outer membrane protein OmpA-like peptidoglycan-associated protein